MKKYLYLLLLTLSLISCQNEKKEVYAVKLREIDSILVPYPDSAHILLSEIDREKLSRSNKVYYNLLYTIASDKNDVVFENDSLIATVTSSSAFKNNPYNSYRANLYRGLVRYRKSEYDSLSYYYFLKAEDICNRYEIPDDSYKRLLYWYIASYNKTYSNFELSEKYFSKEREIIESLGSDKNSICLNDINRYWVYIGQGKIEEASEIINYYQNDNVIPTSFLL